MWNIRGLPVLKWRELHFDIWGKSSIIEKNVPRHMSGIVREGMADRGGNKKCQLV